jgi:hypothetical protein
MNTNKREVEFRQRDAEFDMWVERDRRPFDTYICGVLRKGDDGFFRFHPRCGVAMHCKLLREASDKIAELGKHTT